MVAVRSTCDHRRHGVSTVKCPEKAGTGPQKRAPPGLLGAALDRASAPRRAKAAAFAASCPCVGWLGAGRSGTRPCVSHQAALREQTRRQEDVRQPADRGDRDEPRKPVLGLRPTAGSLLTNVVHSPSQQAFDIRLAIVTECSQPRWLRPQHPPPHREAEQHQTCQHLRHDRRLGNRIGENPEGDESPVDIREGERRGPVEDCDVPLERA